MHYYYYKTSNQGDGLYLHTVGYDTYEGWEAESDHETVEKVD